MFDNNNTVISDAVDLKANNSDVVNINVYNTFLAENTQALIDKLAVNDFETF